MVPAISQGARFVRLHVLRALSPSFRRVRARLAMIEAWQGGGALAQL